MPVREKAIKGPARARRVPSLVPVHTQRAAKPRAFPPTAVEFTAERDSPLEGAGFEPSVPRVPRVGPGPHGWLRAGRMSRIRSGRSAWLSPALGLPFQATDGPIWLSGLRVASLLEGLRP